MTCKGLCQLLSFPLERLRGGRKLFYVLGYKRCKTCAYFTRTESLRCPCCGMRYRTKPVSGEDRQRYLLLVENRRASLI